MRWYILENLTNLTVISNSTNVTDIERVTVTAKELTKLCLFKNDSRIRQLVKEGTFIRVSKGRYLLFESIQNYIKTLKVQKDIQTAKNNDEISYNEERAKHEQIKRMQAELKLALMKGELHKSEDVEAVMTDMLSRIRSRFLQMPTKIAPLLEGKEAGEIKKILSEEVKDILEELKDYQPKDFTNDDFIELGEKQ